MSTLPLFGIATAALEARIATVERRIADLRSQVRSMYEVPQALNVSLDARPPHSIFLCAYLQVSTDFVQYLSQIRSAVRRAVDDRDVVFTDPGTQHCTVMVFERPQTAPTASHIQRWRDLIEPWLGVHPFTLYFCRPLITPEGGLILQGETFSDSLFALRRSELGDADEGGIIHSTFGYVTVEDRRILSTIDTQLEKSKHIGFSFRVHELRIATSLGTKVSFCPESLPLRSRPFANWADLEPAAIFDQCVQEVLERKLERTRALMLLEQALNCIESPLSGNSLLMAERLSELLRDPRI